MDMNMNTDEQATDKVKTPYVYDFEFDELPNEKASSDSPDPENHDDPLEDEEFFMQVLRTAFVEERDEAVKKELIKRLDLFKNVSNAMISQGCNSENFRIAKDFISALDMAEGLVEKVWKFYDNN